MWTRRLLKENAKVAFKRNFWTCVAVSLIAMLLGAGSSGGGIELNYEENNTSGYYEDFDDYNDFYYDDGFYYEESYEDDFEDMIETAFSIIFSPIFLIAAVIALIIGIAISLLLSNVVNVGHKRYYLENREHKTTVGKLFYGFNGERYGSYVWVMFWKGLYIFGWSLLFIIPGIIKAYSYMMVPYIIAENPEISKDRVFEISKKMMDGHKWEAFVLELSFFWWLLLSGVTAGIAGIFYVNPYMDATFAEFYSAIKAEAIQKGITDTIELPGVSYVNTGETFTEQF